MHFTQQRLKTRLGFGLMPVQCFCLTLSSYKVAFSNVCSPFHLLCCPGKISEGPHCNWDSPAQLVDPKGVSFYYQKSYPILCGQLPASAWEHTLAHLCIITLACTLTTAINAYTQVSKLPMWSYQSLQIFTSGLESISICFTWKDGSKVDISAS